jgi:hypothetical protein
MLLIFLLMLLAMVAGWFLARRFAQTPQAQPASLLPQIGMTLSGTLMHRREPVHVYCRVEDNDESRLLIRILSELGRTPLLGMRAGAAGQLEVKDFWLPLDVLYVSVPGVVVEEFTGRAKAARRESLRVPVSFSVRFRAQGLTRQWSRATGINVSAGGFCFSSGFAAELRVGRLYEIELMPDAAGQSGNTFVFLAEMRWVMRTERGTVAGLQLADRAKQPDLAKFVSYMQHRMSRHPEDYLLETNPKPELDHHL